MFGGSKLPISAWKGVILEVKVEKKIFGEKFAKSWSRGFPLEGIPLKFFEIFFLQKLANSKLYFFRVVPSKNFDRSGNANKNRALGANFAPPGAVRVKELFRTIRVNMGLDNVIFFPRKLFMLFSIEGFFLFDSYSLDIIT